MKRIASFLIALTALALSGSLTRAALITGAAITEGPAGLTASIPGFTITGTPDNWIVKPPPGSTFMPFLFGPAGQPVFAVLTEPENPDRFNFLARTGDPVTGAQDLVWKSDLTKAQVNALAPPGLLPFVPVVSTTIELAPLTAGAPAGVVNLQDVGDAPVPPKTSNVPDATSTLPLLGCSLLALLGVARARLPSVKQLSARD